MLRDALALCLLLACSGCTALVDSDAGALGPRPVACQLGAQQACACVGGARGTQTCNEQGKFNPCRCGGPAGAAGSGN